MADVVFNVNRKDKKMQECGVVNYRTSFGYVYEHNVKGLGKEFEKLVLEVVKKDPNAVIVVSLQK